MTDGFGRLITYLRISVIDRCNLRCRYCMPEAGVPALAHAEILRFDEIERLAGIFAALGVNRIRLTGGEPLVRHDLPELAARLKKISGVDFLGLTSNGVLLPSYAQQLYDAGVDGVNISLDTMNADRYTFLTRRDAWIQAWAGVQAALALPFSAVKLNCVLSPDSLPADWLGVVELAQDLPVEVRLIEWMPMSGADRPAVRAEETLDAIEAHCGALIPLEQRTGEGPAQCYAIKGFVGSIGVIPAMSRHFCSSCNRIRLTATGDLKLCLFYDAGISLRDLLRSGADNAAVAAAIQTAVLSKPERHSGAVVHGSGCATCGMSQIGG